MRTKIHKTFFKVADFISWQKQKRLILSPTFQRRSVWKRGAKSFLIDTIVRGLPIPILFIRDRRVNIEEFEAVREIVDGQQRLRTVFSYVCPDYLSDFNIDRDSFTVKRTHNKDIAGKKFSELDKETREAILEYEFDVHILPPDMDDRVVIQIFRRMNSTTYGLTKQELRNAEFYGEFKSAVYELAETQLNRWREWKTFSSDDIARMVEVEFVSECVILMLEKKIVGKSAPHIDSFYKLYEEQLTEQHELESRFRSTIDFIDGLVKESSIPFVLVKKKTCYTFFAYAYNLLFGLDSDITTPTKSKPVKGDVRNQILTLNQKLYDRTAPKDVLNAMDRRTTNPKERKRLYEYLRDSK